MQQSRSRRGGVRGGTPPPVPPAYVAIALFRAEEHGAAVEAAHDVSRYARYCMTEGELKMSNVVNYDNS
jgi:hypothetical protein